MPRVSYVGSRSFLAGEQTHSPENENIDVCRACFQKIEGDISAIRAEFRIPSYVPDNLIQADGGDEHPPYDDEYRCALCRKILGPVDD